MKIYAVISEVDCNNEWNTSYYAYPFVETEKYFSTREKAKQYISDIESPEICTLFDGRFNTREIESDDYGKTFVPVDSDYDYFTLDFYVKEIEVE